jgi:non-homologous end joining protein Ku
MGNYRSKLMFVLGPIQTPVNLMSAIPSKSGDVHLYCPTHKARISQKLTCSAEGEDVLYYNTLRGVDTDQGVRILTASERPSIPPSESVNFTPVATAELEQHTTDAEGTYYCIPSIKAGEEAWAIFAKLAADPKVSLVAKAALKKDSQKLYRLRLFNGYLTLRALQFPDNVKPHPEVPNVKLDRAIWGLVQQFVGQQLATWDSLPTTDDMTEKLKAWVATGELLPRDETQPNAAPNPGETLLATLKEAVERAKTSK